MAYIWGALALVFTWLSGAWWDRERQGAMLLGSIALVIIALSLDGCAVYHACREGLCR
jgi:hypothetical protein